jgi:hypothetical protein
MNSIAHFTPLEQSSFTAVLPFARDSGLSFIEQLQKTCKNPCMRPPRNWILGKDLLSKTVLLIQPSCKTWACPSCAARNAKRWIARIINGVNHMDGDWWMFTLTAHEKMRGQTASVKNLREGWKKLYNRARYEYETASYCKVWEMHDDGKTFHLHGLVDRNWQERWLKDNARECGMGYQVDIHEVDNAGQVAGYIAKYFLKSESIVNDGNPFPKNLRRIEVSRNWLELPKMAEYERFQWTVFQTVEGARRNAAWLQKEGFRVVDLLPKNEAVDTYH